MSIKARLDMESGKFVNAIVCDRCGKEVRDDKDYSRALGAIKEAGWKSVNELMNGGWKDYCPECWEGME